MLLTGTSTKHIRKLVIPNSLNLEKTDPLFCGSEHVFQTLHPVEYWYNRSVKIPLPKKDVMPLSVRERILAIRLMDKVNANPAAAKKLGIVVVNGPEDLRNTISEK